MKRLRRVPTPAVSRPAGTPCPNLETLMGQGLSQPSQPFQPRTHVQARAPAGRRACACTPTPENRLVRLVRLGQGNNGKGLSVPTSSQPAEKEVRTGVSRISPAKHVVGKRYSPAQRHAGKKTARNSRRGRRGRISSQAACEWAVCAAVKPAVTAVEPVRFIP